MDIAPDKQIMEHLIRQSGEDFRYRRSLIRAMKKNQILPDATVLQQLEEFNEQARNKLVDMV